MQNFKNVNGVCNNATLLSKIHNYLLNNASNIKYYLEGCFNVLHEGKQLTVTITSGCYAHTNIFEVSATCNNVELGYCTTLHNSYIN